MKSVAGIFSSRDTAERAIQRLAASGIPREHLTLLTPGTDVRRLSSVPVDEGEPPGTGAAIGNALETTLSQGVPRDDLFVIEDALRSGHSVALALVEDEAAAQRAREALRDEGALDMETARDRWWTSLTEAERGVFNPVEEHAYRCGFEAAQWCDNRENVRSLHGDMIDEPAFQRGWERGLDYRHAGSLRKSA